MDTPRLSPATMDFMAGAVAGALSIATTQPLDTLRIRMQSPQGFAAAGVTAVPGAPLPKKAGSQILKCMVQKEGLLSPFKGMSFPLAFTSLQSALIFQIYGTTLRFLGEPEDTHMHSEDHVGNLHHAGHAMPTVWNGFLAGCTAGLAQVALWSPIEMLKIRLQLQTARPGSKDYIGPSKMLKRILTTEGVPGLYRGITVTALRDLPSYGIYFAAYHALAQSLQPGVPPEDASALTQVLAGGTAGCVAWMSIYPLDVVKSRMQASADHGASGSRPSWLHYARLVYREGGTAALWRGIQPTLARAFVMDAVSFLGYTSVLRLLKKDGS